LKVPRFKGLNVCILSALLFLLAACGFLKQDCSRPEIFCVALVTDTGGLHDHGLTQSAWDDIQRAQADDLIQHSAYIESVDARDYGKNIELLVREQFDVIVSAGISMHDDTLRVADLNPGTVFIGLDQPPDDLHTNFASMTFPEDQAGFLAGALAAEMTQTGIVAAACESSGLASNWRTCEGFRAGAIHQKPEVDVLVEYRDQGSQENLFRDTEWGYDTALELIRDGADVVFGVGGGTGQGALLGAADEAVYAIGSEQDQFHVTREAQSVLLTSFVKSASPALYDLLCTLQLEAALRPDYPGSISIAPFHNQDGRVPEHVKARLIELEIQLSQNIISTGVPIEPPK
jgi:basic membrane protein A and related proteins